MNRNATKLALLALTASAGAAQAQVFIPMNAPGKNYNEGRTNTAANGIVSFTGLRDNGDPVTGLWDWQTDEVAETPTLYDDFGQALPFEPLQLRTTAARGPGDPIKGINIGLIKKPRPSAAIWDTSEGAPGFSYELTNAFGADSWATTASVDNGIIGGALFGDLSGNGETRHAAVWVNGGDAQLLPVPADTVESEIRSVSIQGHIGVGSKAISTKGVQSGYALVGPSAAVRESGMIWDLDNGSYTEIDPNQVGAESLIFSGLSADNSRVTTWTAHADNTTKAGLFEIASQSYTLLDAGDINGDGQIDFNDRHDTAAYALSADGSVIAGSYTLPGGQETAAFWSTATGYQMQDLLSYLSTEGVSGLDGWHLTSITGVSADGTLFSGSGFNPAGQNDVWVAVIPTPASASLLAMGGLLAARRRRAD